MKRPYLLLSCLWLGCAFDGSGFNSPGDPVDGGDPVIDAFVPAIDGDVPMIDAGLPDASLPDAFVCTDDDNVCLDESTQQLCTGGELVSTTCALGCLAAGGAHCAVIVPSNGLDLDWLAGADAAVVIADNETWVFETQTGVVQRCGAAQVHGAAVGIQGGINFQKKDGINTWSLASLRVQEGGTLRVIGTVPGALLVGGEARIEGTVDASAGATACNLATACGGSGQRFCAGPGGGTGGEVDKVGLGNGGGAAGTKGGAGDPETGGGGGGYGAGGGRGGGSPGVNGGGSYGTVELTPLVGGSGGGGGGQSTGNAGRGGGGGGALQLVSLVEIEIDEEAVLRAAGSGGSAGEGALNNGGGGGGAGGGLLCEAPSIIVAGAIAANGGGGGGGGNNSGPGQDGRGNATPAPGGVPGAGFAGGDGGAGAVNGAGLAGAPGSPTNLNPDGSGGGGGGVGRIFLRTRPGGLDTRGGLLSPPPGLGTIPVQ